MKFLHISDLHYNPKTDGRTSRKMREQLPEYLLQNGITAEELLITGDYRHAVLQKNDPPDEVASDVVEYILTIAAALGIKDSKSHIHLVPGNHDLDRDVDTTRIDQIRKKYSSDSGVFLPDDLAYLRAQFSFFDLVCQKLYGGDSFWQTAPLHTCRLVGNTTLLFLNTAVMHHSSQDRGRLLIGNDELDRLLKRIKEKKSGCSIVVLAHHPPDYFEEAEKKAVEDIFRKHTIQLYLCGDAHTVWWRNINGYLEITMGCIKTEEGVQTSFLWGDTDQAVYTAHHWVEAWEPYVKFNKSLRNFLRSRGDVPRALSEVVKKEQEQMKNDVLLPWMKNSAAYRVVFPKLFIKPEFRSAKAGGKLNYQDLVDGYLHKTIAVIGDAGAGKTTLLQYLFLYHNPDLNLLYLRASRLRCAVSELSDYEATVRSILLGNQKAEGRTLILLDGIDEAYFEDCSDLIKLIGRTSNQVSVWFGWRAEHYYQKETEAVRRMTTEVAMLQPWDLERARIYVWTYGEETQQESILSDFQALLDRDEDIESFTKSPFQLTLLVYLLENKQKLPEIQRYLASKDRSIYGLYDQFFNCWLVKERERGTSRLPAEAVSRELQTIAGRLYYESSYELCEKDYNDSAISGLLTFTAQKHQKTAIGFYHRSFCAFFCAKKIVDTLQSGGAALIEALRIPLRNDITDFVRSAVSVLPEEKRHQIQKHLIRAYWQAIHPCLRILDVKVRRMICKSSKDEKFYLRNELIYLATRISGGEKRAAFLLKAAYMLEKDPYMRLDIAYGAVLTGPSRIALEYARSLVPGSTSDLVNRSWTLAYFGDVQANPYHYRDDGKVPWNKSRSARLARFQSQKRKAIRFRILDIPLMYCFYASRDWADVNEEDYEKICQTDIECSEYTQEEKAFLREHKAKLLEEYQKRLKEACER